MGTTENVLGRALSARLRAVLAALLLLPAGAAAASELFASSEPLEIELSGPLDRVLARREAILDIADTLPDPGGRVVAPAKRYLDGFFRKADDRERLLQRFESRCL